MLNNYLVCSVDELVRQSADSFTHIVSIGDPGTDLPPICHSFGKGRCLRLQFDDVIEADNGKAPAEPSHVAAILCFGREIEQHAGARTLVHCHFGISRSTAAAITLMVQSEPEADPLAIMERVAATRVHAWPNSRVIRIADELLGRGGRLSAALTAFQARRVQLAPHIVPILLQNGRAADVEAAQACIAAEMVSPGQAVSDECHADWQHAQASASTGFFGTQASGCIFLARDTGRFLMVRRSSMVDQPGTWGTVGGAHLAEEDSATGALREAGEETGFAGHADLAELYVFTRDTFTYRTYLAVVEEQFAPVLNWENQEASWVRYGDWPKPLHFGLAAILSDEGASQIMADLSSELDAAACIDDAVEVARADG